MIGLFMPLSFMLQLQIRMKLTVLELLLLLLKRILLLMQIIVLTMLIMPIAVLIILIIALANFLSRSFAELFSEIYFGKFVFSN